MSFFDDVKNEGQRFSERTGAAGAYNRNIDGAKLAGMRAIPQMGYGGDWWNMKLGNAQWDLRDPRSYAIMGASSVLGPAGMPLAAAYMGNDARQTAQFNRKTRRVAGIEGRANERLNTTRAVSGGMGMGGAGYAMASQGYNDILRQMDEMQKQNVAQKRAQEQQTAMQMAQILPLLMLL